MDWNKVTVDTKYLPQLSALNTAKEIKDYINNLLEFLKGLIKRIVLAAKDIAGYFYP